MPLKRHGSFYFCLIFLSRSALSGLPINCARPCSLCNPSQSAIMIVRALKTRYTGNMGTAFIRQMEHCWFRAQAWGHNMGSYGVGWMIDRDNLDVGQEHVTLLKV